MSSPWKTEATSTKEVNFAEILSEEYALKLQKEENKRYERAKQRGLSESIEEANFIEDDNGSEAIMEPTTSQEATKPKLVVNEGDGELWEDYSALLVASELAPQAVVEKDVCHDDVVIARMLQSQFDHEYNEELRRIENSRNKNSKVKISLDKFRRHGDLEFLDDEDDEYDDANDDQKRDWDRFETNEKKFKTIPKCGFKIDEDGEMITKHDPQLCGVRNACRVMSFPLHLSTGDAAGFEMSLPNNVFNQLKSYFSHRPDRKKTKMHNRKENMATAEMGVDARTRLLLYKLINKQLLEQINGIVSTGKEALILHANSDPNYVEEEYTHKKRKSSNKSSEVEDEIVDEGAESEQLECQSNTTTKTSPMELPKECAIKIFRTTLNEFKQRDRYIKDDFRFKDRFSSQDNFYIINLWAEKEMHNLKRMKAAGINCPEVVTLKKHVLVMSFIGENHRAAPKLKDACLSAAECSCAYEEIVDAMFKLYNVAKLVHADLSEYNILWHDGKCFFIDVAQSVEPEHPSALEFLLRDCANIINFFTKKGLPNIYTKEELFQHITSLNAETEVGLLERIHTRGASIQVATAPDHSDCPDELKPIAYPFDVAWEKSQSERQKKIIDTAADAMKVLNVKCSVEAVAVADNQKDSIENTNFANIVATGNLSNTAEA